MTPTKVKNVLPELPFGTVVADKPANIEMQCRGRRKYANIIDTLKLIDRTKSVQMEVKTMNKAQIANIVTGVRVTARIMKFDYPIKYCCIDGILHIWSNR